VLLGVGRAIGETMAATVMLAGVPRISEPLVNVFYGYETLTSLIARGYGSANGVHESALFAAGVVLFVTVLCLSLGSQYIERAYASPPRGCRMSRATQTALIQDDRTVYEAAAGTAVGLSGITFAVGLAALLEPCGDRRPVAGLELSVVFGALLLALRGR